MKTIFKRLLASATLICLTTVNADTNPTTFVGPTLTGVYADKINSFTAYSVLGEIGIKNFRIGATVGWQLVENQRLKISGEYLWQKITYPFFVGNIEEWVQQGAIGGLYQYQLCDMWHTTLDLDAYYSYAPSKNLSAASGIVITNNIFQSFVDHRRIAGSTAYGFAPGITSQPLAGTIIGAALNYDNVTYDKSHHPHENALGWGTTFSLNQRFYENIVLNVTTAFRKPFNNYMASIDYVNVPYFGLWTFGVNGAYTVGKNSLPHTWNVGINAIYTPEAVDVLYERAIGANFNDFDFKCCPKSIPDNFISWTTAPAVYMPQVLAIPDENLVITCSAAIPRVIGALPLVQVLVLPVTINAAALFSPSAGLTYSLDVTPPLLPGKILTINSTTGVIFAANIAGINQAVTATITATNQCGNTASTTIQFQFIRI